MPVVKRPTTLEHISKEYEPKMNRKVDVLLIDYLDLLMSLMVRK